MIVTYTWNGVEIDYALVADPDFTHSGVVIVDNKVMGLPIAVKSGCITYHQLPKAFVVCN